MYRGFEDNKVKKKSFSLHLKLIIQKLCKVFVRPPVMCQLNSAKCVIKWILTVGFLMHIHMLYITYC